MKMPCVKHTTNPRLAYGPLVLAFAFCGLGAKAPQDHAVAESAAAKAPAFTAGDYQTALKDAILFFDGNKCGPNVAVDNVFSWRGACHTQDQNAAGGDMSGGFHDAGDFLKMGLTQGFSPAIMGFALNEYRSTFDATGNTAKLLSTLRYFTDYFLKSHPNPSIFYYEVGLDSDHDTWRPPEFDSGVRTAPSNYHYWADASNAASDICGETAAALAFMSINIRSSDSAYADRCLQAAKEIYALGTAKLGVGRSNQDGTFYGSSGYYDHLALGALALNLATGTASYLADAKTYIAKSGKGSTSALGWDDVEPLVNAKLLQMTGNSLYQTYLRANLDYFNTGVKKTPGGLRFYDAWDPLDYASTEGFIGLYYARITGDASYAALAKSQIDYILGANPKGISYMIGFGSNWCQHPEHCAANGYLDLNWTGAYKNAAKYTLTGGLVGGPAADDSFTDVANDAGDLWSEQCEVALDYNSGFVADLAAFVATLNPTQTVAVSVSPTTAALNPGGTQTFTASVTGTSNPAVTWTATGGTVTTAGEYTAPAALGTYTVTATSVADTTKSASAQVTVSSTVTDTNIAPGGTAYGWSKNTSATSNSNRVAMPGLNDNNLTVGVDLQPNGDAAKAWEAAGVLFSAAKTLSSADVINGTVTSGGDGFLTAKISCQYTTNGTTWQDTGWTVSPAYPYNSSASGKTYTFKGAAVSGALGLRVVGQVRTADTSYHWIVKELQVQGH